MPAHSENTNLLSQHQQRYLRPLSGSLHASGYHLHCQQSPDQPRRSQGSLKKNWYKFYRFVWQKLPTHRRLFLQVALHYQNVLYQPLSHNAAVQLDSNKVLNHA